MPEQVRLKIPEQEKLKKELGFVDPASITVEPVEDQVLVTLAEEYVEKLCSVNPEDFRAQAQGRAAIDNLGTSLVQESARRSEMLRSPIRTLIKDADGKDIGSNLIRLKLEVEKHDPHKWDFEAGWFSRLVGRTPVVGGKIKEYFTQFEEARTVIDAIANSLSNGKEQLGRDIKILREDQIAMREVTLKLQKIIKVGMLMDKGFEKKLAGLAADDPQRGFIEQERLFPLRQQINGLQTQLGFNQVGVIAYETIVRTNLELIKGINMTVNTTVTGLTVATVLALALAHQKDQMDKILKTNEVTARLFIETTERLRKQGVDVQKMVSSPLISVEIMKTAYANLRAAFDEVMRFKQEALPKMATNMLEFDRVTADMEKLIRDQEKGNASKSDLATMEIK